MAGLFNKVKAQAAPKASAAKKKETVWLVGGSADSAPVAEAVKQLVVLAAQAKAIETKQGVFKAAVKGFAEKSYVKDFAATGVSPETPMQVATTDGEKVTFVCQDRSSQYQIKDDQKEALVELLGEDAVKDLLFEETTFGFNRDVLAFPGVMEVVEKALESALRKLTDDKEGKPILSEEVASQLLDVKVKTAFRPGTMDRLPLICGKDVTRIEQFMEIAGSNLTRYIKV